MALVIAHRGSHEAAPENTLDAFVAAAEAGADMVEFDVRRSADDRLVVFHDQSVRTASVADLTLAELRTATGILVPELEEVLAWASGRIGIDVELKEDGYVPQVMTLLAGFRGRILVTSFLDTVLQQVQDQPRGLLVGLWTEGVVERARRCRAEAIVLQHLAASEALVAAIAAADLDLYLWDYLPGAALPAEVVGVITDDVPGARSALEGRQG